MFCYNSFILITFIFCFNKILDTPISEDLMIAPLLYLTLILVLIGYQLTDLLKGKVGEKLVGLVFDGPPETIVLCFLRDVTIAI